MNVRINKINDKENECIVIECVEVTPDIESIRAYALTKGTLMSGKINEGYYQFNLSEVIYFEAIDERVFAYTKRHTYELKTRLYELENAYENQHFVRCSKSFILNLMMLSHISPALNGRFTAQMKNGEKVIISRQYVSKIKEIVVGGK